MRAIRRLQNHTLCVEGVAVTAIFRLAPRECVAVTADFRLASDKRVAAMANSGLACSPAENPTALWGTWAPLPRARRDAKLVGDAKKKGLSP